MVWATWAVVQQLVTNIDKYGPRLQDPDFVHVRAAEVFSSGRKGGERPARISETVHYLPDPGPETISSLTAAGSRS